MSEIKKLDGFNEILGFDSRFNKAIDSKITNYEIDKVNDRFNELSFDGKDGNKLLSIDKEINNLQETMLKSAKIGAYSHELKLMVNDIKKELKNLNRFEMINVREDSGKYSFKNSPVKKAQKEFFRNNNEILAKGVHVINERLENLNEKAERNYERINEKEFTEDIRLEFHIVKANITNKQLKSIDDTKENLTKINDKYTNIDKKTKKELDDIHKSNDPERSSKLNAKYTEHLKNFNEIERSSFMTSNFYRFEKDKIEQNKEHYYYAGKIDLIIAKRTPELTEDMRLAQRINDNQSYVKATKNNINISKKIKEAKDKVEDKLLPTSYAMETKSPNKTKNQINKINVYDKIEESKIKSRNDREINQTNKSLNIQER